MRAPFGLYEPGFHHDACGVGFIAERTGQKSHRLIEDAVRILIHLEHRGAVGGDGKTGDGAGMLLQIPHDFFVRAVSFPLPEAGCYGAGFLFLPREEEEAGRARELVEQEARREGAAVLGWRRVPVDPGCLGEQARREMPSFWQLFLTPPAGTEPGEPTERRLYVLRRCLEREAAARGWGRERFYLPSLSSRTIVYKGMFVSPQFMPFYPDLGEPDFASALAIVHQRYSTNTLPSWFLAQPFRLVAHNGEINTLRRNVNNMRAREATLSSPLFGADLEKLLPIVDPAGSDSAIFDNVLELLALGGRSLPHALAMMVPEAFGTKYHISEDKRAFFEYHAAIMEPWDGPAAMAFSDGVLVGALLDRNGLRPARYLLTRGGLVLLASEAGVLDVDPADILEKGRLAPGRMLLVDTARGRVIRDHEVKAGLSRRQPYRHWLDRNRILLRGLFGVPRPVAIDRERLPVLQRSFGYTREDLLSILAPMAENAQEPIGSMGDDTPPAVLSRRPQLLFDYFRQLFAQVTNPPIDPYRENLVMSLMSFVGRERNLLAETPEHCRQLKLSHPFLTNDDLEQLREADLRDFPVVTVPILFPARAGGLRPALAEVCREAERRIDEGASLVILSDRGVGAGLAAIPSLLAVGAVHHHLVRAGRRHLSALVVETGEAREVHHFACLIGYGASGVNPYLAFETIRELQEQGGLTAALSAQAAAENYITALKKGLLKIMSKMGISTLRSYRGSQIFEALGIGRELVELAFAGTASRIGGIGLEVVEQEKLALHEAAFAANPGAAADPCPELTLPSGGVHQQRRGEERHLFSAQAIALLQRAVREGDYGLFLQYAAVVDGDRHDPCTLRSLLRPRAAAPVPLEEVEPEPEILRRFVTSAMSLGSLSPEAHEALAEAMNRLGLRSNSGEGGEAEERYAGPRGSRVKQVASARFGVTSAYLVSAEELQIKMAQGAKPGEGGQLPGPKVDETIARVRHSTPGVMLVSPPPHHDIYSIEDLAQLIYDLKQASPRARISVKLVSEVGVGTVAAGVVKGRADTVLISGGDGGTGAAPLTSIRHAGLPWELGLAEAQQVLVASGLRERVRLQVDGQLKTGRDVLIAAMLGAEEFGFATTALVSLGCVLVRRCHLNSCPVGVATQDPRLRRRFAGRAEHVENFMRFLARQVRELLAEAGFRRLEELVGRADLLEVDPEAGNPKTRTLELDALLVAPEPPPGGSRRATRLRPDPFPPSLDAHLLDFAREALEGQDAVEIEVPVRNSDRAVGAALSAEVSRRRGSRGLPPGTVRVRLKGSAGQSFGAFLAPGLTLELEGEANDYLGKGLSGGRLVVYPPRGSAFAPERNSIVGNVALFGATGGEVFINGLAGERFAVRNSGALAVVEGVGDHGCEYMTGGRVVVLGETGVNFAAGMSGGLAYVLDRGQLFDTRCNLEMVDVEPLTDEDRRFLHAILSRHRELTGSPQAERVLAGWEETLPLFVKVIPLEYREALKRIRESELKESETVKLTEEVYF